MHHPYAARVNAGPRLPAERALAALVLDQGTGWGVANFLNFLNFLNFWGSGARPTTLRGVMVQAVP